MLSTPRDTSLRAAIRRCLIGGLYIQRDEVIEVRKNAGREGREVVVVEVAYLVRSIVRARVSPTAS